MIATLAHALAAAPTEAGALPGRQHADFNALQEAMTKIADQLDAKREALPARVLEAYPEHPRARAYSLASSAVRASAYQAFQSYYHQLSNAERELIDRQEY